MHSPERRLTSLLVLMLVALLAAATALALPCRDYSGDLRLIGNYTVEGLQDEIIGYSQLQIKGLKAYAWEHSEYGHISGALQVFDVIDPAVPVARGRLEFGWGVEARGLTCLDHYVLLATGNLLVIDVDDHDAPVQVLALEPGGDASDVVVSQRLAYIGLDGAAQAVGVWDFNNPLQPFQLATVPVAGPVHSLSLHGGLLLVGGEGFLEVLDLSSPTMPTSLGSLALAGAVTDIAARGDLGVVEHGGGATLVDLTDPATPYLLATLPQDGGFTVTSVALRDGFAWVGRRNQYHTSGDLQFFDLTDPAAPVAVGSHVLAAWPAALAFTSGEVFVGCVDMTGAGWPTGRLEVFRDGDVTSPRAGFLDLAANDLNFEDGVLAGDHLYVLGELDLGVVSVADAATPAFGSSQSLIPYFGQDVAAAGAWLAVSLRHITSWPHQYVLRAFDLTDPANPQARGEVDFGSDQFRLSALGDLIYVGALEGASGGGIRVYAIDTAGEFSLLGTIWPGESAGVICGDGGERAVLYRNDTLLLAELADPLAPVILGSLPYDQADPAIPVAWVGDRIYTRRDGGWPVSRWQMLDVSDPSAPVLLADIPLLPNEQVGDISVQDDVVYVAGSYNIYAYDTLDELAPALVGTLPHTSVYSDVVLCQHAEALIAASHGGVATWPYHCQTTAVDDGGIIRPATGLPLVVAPNPFNPRTTITWSLPRAQHVAVGIYDLTGKRVRELAAAPFARGDHRLSWDGRDDGGRDLPSGAYLIRVATRERVAARKVLLVR